MEETITFSNETLNTCTVVKIGNLMPKKLSMEGVNSVIKDGFLFISREKEGIRACMNLGFAPSKREKESLKKFLVSWGGGEKAEVRNTILEMEFPQFIIPFYERINAIPGCRVDPNVLHSNGDVYVCIEFHGSLIKEVNDVIADFAISEHIFPKSIVYSGPQKAGLPYLLQMYGELGNSLENFVMVKTSWNYEPEQILKENQGVLQNLGTYVPKEFTESNYEPLIFRKEEAELKGEASAVKVSDQDRIVEFQVKSRFFFDFSNEVIKRYSGPIFMHLELLNEKQNSYYIVEKDLQVPFLKGLYENWGRPARAQHTNYIEQVKGLEEVAEDLR